MSGDPARPMSIDAMLDMERQEVLALLENKNQGSTSPERVRATSPFAAPPRSPVRSMLDIDEEGPSNTRTAPSTQAPPPVRSMLDLDSPSPPPSATLRSASPASPGSSVDPKFKSSMSQGSFFTQRSMSGSGSGLRPADFGPRAGNRNDRTSEYQFSGILSHNTGQPKRASQVNKRMSSGALGDSLRGPDLSSLQLPGDRGRHEAAGGRLGNQSKSPHNRWEARSRSPAPLSPLLSPNKAKLGGGQLLDINNAYRRLSDANLAFSSGSLAQLPMRKQRSEELGEGRLIKDYLGPDGEQLESSDEEEAHSSDDEDRGRKTAPRSLNPDARGDKDQSKSRSPSGRKERQSLSLLAAADAERRQVASQRPAYQYRSLIPEPEIKITNSAGDTSKPSKTGIHPNTSYERGSASATPSMMDSDEEADMDDIKRAQKLSFFMSSIMTSPESHRAIRIIDRGEYTKIAQQAEEEHHRLRKYLVATDLSDESAHALEWAIGTVLRDGDTLIAIYCVDEETGIVTGEGVSVPDDPKAMKEQAAAINTVTNAKSLPTPLSPVTELKRASALYLRNDSSGTPGSSPGPSRDRKRADEERHRAIDQMTDKVFRLLRKTRLQVRVIVEVLHCKNPRHLITEVIDLVNPTLVVIGSRGRSALKGVILGSFSNYLVTKSSVPVMVARKRLRKQSKYNKRTPVRQVNNLSNPAARSLANAKID
ncbi:universal stress protein family domain-containing protein [Hirsutella rhossiliensis]|uniref:Universal stress protein family domain-containing protein n=1 Tax=Hirsutella rhossiliensis TaxID=111463 RepID=A0A9P8SG64_9HYPO|nr:universal stress protein family domain-containing protein [Hirsutella rhossiliensis]KAH0961668.1 universal stress protein family domain-containing protein [Hirsutella rhossiliensis]